MGMYFVVEKEEGDVCPYCQTPIVEWQSKSAMAHDEWGGCCDRHPDPLPTVRKNEVETFYEICSNPDCKKWIEYKVIPLHYELVPDNDN